MSSDIHFRQINSSWGVSLQLFAELVKCDAAPYNPLCVDYKGEDVGVDVVAFAEIGVSAVWQYYPEEVQALTGMRMLISEIRFSDCDFQPEGISCAAAAWLCRELRVPKCPIGLSFEADQNRYVLTFLPK